MFFCNYFFGTQMSMCFNTQSVLITKIHLFKFAQGLHVLTILFCWFKVIVLFFYCIILVPLKLLQFFSYNAIFMLLYSYITIFQNLKGDYLNISPCFILIRWSLLYLTMFWDVNNFVGYALIPPSFLLYKIWSFIVNYLDTKEIIYFFPNFFCV